jgi:excisionase family DNA binding protein
MSERSYYTLSEAAHVLGVHYETAARWVRSGKLPGVKLSRRKVIIPKEKLDAFLAGQATAARAPDDLPFGSPQRWLALAGTLTHEEAEQLRAFAEVFETIEDVP